MYKYRINLCLLFRFVSLQRATLAEKEVSALKEQLASSNQPHSDTQKVSGNSDDLTSHRPLEIELSAKDKEVRF